MLIDDMPAVLEEASALMEGHYELVTAAGREDALEKLKSFSPDIAIIDMYLENESAYALFDGIRGGKDIPVLFTGSDISVTALSKIFALGVSDFVRKPFVENILFRKIEEQLKLFETGFRYAK